MISNTDAAYIAGLFDGEGCVTYKQRREHRKGKPRSYLYWQIRIEINMIDSNPANNPQPPKRVG